MMASSEFSKVIKECPLCGNKTEETTERGYEYRCVSCGALLKRITQTRIDYVVPFGNDPPCHCGQLESEHVWPSIDHQFVEMTNEGSYVSSITITCKSKQYDHECGHRCVLRVKVDGKHSGLRCPFHVEFHRFLKDRSNPIRDEQYRHTVPCITDCIHHCILTYTIGQNRWFPFKEGRRGLRCPYKERGKRFKQGKTSTNSYMLQA